nr:immunoglobulin light chain junction region [Macaca mulatta]MOY15024.1 immunoglobulin light chain junction region [Macaca mulatta]MOY15813.1 immunoglobulin light chain junction region [Macaca mulatta]MOY16027.1 immunoglobulin light chain junction region [Macaca mulatta]MOY16882.1 immunoglobulin light chain junction region [Macaca mulatta]
DYYCSAWDSSLGTWVY